jgi:hypothetical protein
MDLGCIVSWWVISSFFSFVLAMPSRFSIYLALVFSFFPSRCSYIVPLQTFSFNLPVLYSHCFHWLYSFLLSFILIALVLHFSLPAFSSLASYTLLSPFFSLSSSFVSLFLGPAYLPLLFLRYSFTFSTCLLRVLFALPPHPSTAPLVPAFLPCH